MVTISDVCKLANVSKATVSRVLTGNRKVKEETRVAVMKAVTELNYQPNQLAQTLATKVSHTIGVIASGVEDGLFGRFMRQLEQAACQQGLSLFMAHCDVPNADPKAFHTQLNQKLQQLTARHCDAIVLLGTGYDRDWIRHLDRTRLPTLLSLDTGFADIDGVSYDMQRTSEMACHYLCAHGHRQIAVLPETGESGEAVISGYQRALAQHSLPYNARMILNGSDISGAISTLVDDYMPFSAIVTMDDIQAATVIQTLSHYNIMVPQEASVISLRTGAEGARYLPAITGFQMPEATMIQALMTKLTQSPASAKAIAIHPTSHTVMNGKLVIRDSVRTL